MSYYGKLPDRQKRREARPLPQVSRKTLFILCVVTVGIFAAFGIGRFSGERTEREILESQPAAYEPFATVGNQACPDGNCETGIREKGRSILDRLRRR
ncbi:MAG: hypothetical protein ACR2NF_06190 [Pirellulales bacterium]